MYTSPEFSTKVYNWLEEFGSRLVFVIGGADGLPAELKQYQYVNNSYSNNNSGNAGGSSGVLNRSPTFISLSKMTFTHPWARTILVEQIYRASEIHKGSGYHKE
jgi:23S rRNA (pseudouridine1915-N3)-methyltransferase